jgi:hypothetical protein
MKKTVLIFGLTVLGWAAAYGQTSATEVTPAQTHAVRPADGKPYVFPTETLRAQLVPVKIAELQQLITDNAANAELVLTYQESIWRYENAIVTPISGSNYIKN